MDRLSSTMLCTIVFALVGPVLGTISMLTYVNLTSAIPLEFTEWFALDMWWVYVIAGVVGYMLGVLPAALSGLAFGAALTMYRLGRTSSAFTGAIIGAAMLLMVTSITARTLPSGESLVIVLTLGAISGSLCGLASNFIVTGSNNSFKPKPLRGSA